MLGVRRAAAVARPTDDAHGIAAGPAEASDALQKDAVRVDPARGNGIVVRHSDIAAMTGHRAVAAAAEDAAEQISVGGESQR